MTIEHKSGEYRIPDCHPRIDALEKRIEVHSTVISKHNERLHEGDIVFDRLTGAVDRLTQTMQRVIDSTETRWQQKIIEAIIFWLVPLVGGGILWSILHSGAVK